MTQDAKEAAEWIVANVPNHTRSYYVARAYLSARQGEDGWQPITAEHEKSGRKFLVTNNLKARDAYGDLSHVWLSFVIKGSMAGEWVGYDEGDRLIENLTHCMSVPPPSPSGEGENS